jgi:transposase
MKILQTKPHFSDEELQTILYSQTKIRAFKDWQIIYCVQTNYGQQSETIAKMLGATKSKVLYVIQMYNKYGKNWRTHDKWGGRRQGRCHLSLEDEKNLMQSLENEALSGKFLTFRRIKQFVENKVGKEVSEDYIWDLFSRHGWSKKMPRPYHGSASLTNRPKADKASQEEYKKPVLSEAEVNSKKIWSPSH